MTFTTSAPVVTLGQYEIRKVQGTCWDGQYVVIRSADEDILSVHGGKAAAFAKMTDFDCGIAQVETKEQRLAKLAKVPTDQLTATLAALDPYRDWKAVRDIKTALASR